MAGRSNWGNISAVFQLDPGPLDPFLPVLKKCMALAGTSRRLNSPLLRLYFSKKRNAEQNDMQDYARNVT
jgi:hypothetical protein